MPQAQLTKHNCRRAGISLIEILMSIGIVGVGLMGVAALIPVANDYANKAIIRDRASELGQRAFREFKLRGFDQPGTWNSPFWLLPVVGGAGVTNSIFYHPVVRNLDPNWEAGQIAVQAYCFDPVYVASRLANPLVARFPGDTTIPFFVPRITALASRPEQLYQYPPIPPAPLILPENRYAAVNSDLASGRPILMPETFAMLADDLVFQTPNDESLPRFQEFRTYGTPPIRNARLNQGDFSWMATIVPEFEVRAGAIPYTFRKSDNYNLSIAVFHRRVVNDPQKPVQEIIAPVVSPAIPGSYTSSGMGSSSKEFQIDPTVVYNPALGATFDEMQPGDWILIGQSIAGVNILKWMKVTSTPEIITVAGKSNYHFSASGSDLNYFMPDPIPTFVIYIRNVVNVYEKTVRLQKSSGYEN